MTNLGTFRTYLENYLHKHPKIHQDMTFLVRHLQPTDKGIPLEIYVFSKDQAWANYEAIQADIFDHILAVLPEFGLRVFQNPTGHDFQKLASAE
jgi:miniconductance mechanosensitive channel